MDRFLNPGIRTQQKLKNHKQKKSDRGRFLNFGYYYYYNISEFLH